MSVLGSLGFGSVVSIATTRLGLKPSGTLNKSQKLRSRRPAATISTRESANSLITRTWRKRERCREPLEPRPSCPSVTVKLRRLVSHAGASPKIIPAATETMMANASTPQLMDISLKRGRLSGINCSRNFRAPKSTAKPVTPPSTKSSKLSVRSWRMRRPLAAPNAWRTAISRPLALARVSSKLAKPETLIGWHRKGFKLFWKWKSQAGRPRIPENIGSYLTQVHLQHELDSNNYGIFLSDNDLHIKVKRMVYLSGRSDFKTRRNNCAAQPSFFPRLAVGPRTAGGPSAPLSASLAAVAGGRS